MRALELTRDVLNDIINEGEVFQAALKKMFPRDSADRPHGAMVSALTGCTLRHYALFLELLKRVEVTYEDGERFLILAAFSNNFFLKRLAVEDVSNWLKETLGEKYVPALDALLHREESVLDILRETIRDDSLDFIALRFNTPKWLVRMWQRQFGRGLTFKLLKRNNRPPLVSCRVNTLKTDAETIIKDNGEAFSKSKVDDVLIYQGRTPLRRLDCFRSFQVFQEKMALKHVLDEVFHPGLKDAAIYVGKDDAAVRDLLLRLEQKTTLRVIVPDLAARPELARHIRYYRDRHVELIEDKDDVPSEEVFGHGHELVIVYPKSSSFDEIRQYPDLLLHFDRATFTDLIAQQQAVLAKAAGSLVEDGRLLYLVDTLSKREGHHAVMDLLAAHRDFELIEEKQYYPFDELDTALYFAILQKVGESRSD